MKKKIKTRYTPFFLSFWSTWLPTARLVEFFSLSLPFFPSFPANKSIAKQADLSNPLGVTGDHRERRRFSLFFFFFPFPLSPSRRKESKGQDPQPHYFLAPFPLSLFFRA